MVVKIVKTLLKHIDIVPIAKVATVPAKSVQKPIGELLTGGAKNTVSTGINGLKSLRTKLSTKIEAYNARKLAVSKKFGTSEKILNNWNDCFGMANKDGVYQNAINHLNKSGSIDDYIIDRIPNLPKNSKDKKKIKTLLNQYLEKNLENRFTCEDIITTLKDMNFYEIEGEGYIPTYTSTDLTDALHEAFGFRTDYQIVTTKQMKKLKEHTLQKKTHP